MKKNKKKKKKKKKKDTVADRCHATSRFRFQFSNFRFPFPSPSPSHSPDIYYYRPRYQCQIASFYFAPCVRKIAITSDVIQSFFIGNQPLNTMVGFRFRDSVPSARYSSVCNVLCL